VSADALPLPAPRGAVFRRAALWLVFLAPFFYLTYGFANWYASTRPDVPYVVFSWERFVPFMAWTIIPYWSINAFYALSLFVNDDARGVNRLAERYLTAQIVAVICFVAFPLTATFTRPETSGLPGFMFDALTGFDKPFNQAPSLHIALLVIIWHHLRGRLPGWARPAWHVWCLLIGASVLTTYQHHFIDIPTGALLGFVALWLFPAKGDAPLAGFAFTESAKRRTLGAYYMAGSLVLLAVAWVGAYSNPLWLILLWPSLSLLIVALGYLGAGAKVFQKNAGGRVSLASRVLVWPYRVGARINVWAWTRKLEPSVMIADGIHLGRFPSRGEAAEFATIIDLAAELFPPSHPNWHALPLLDLVEPDSAKVAHTAKMIEAARAEGPVLVCCALGFQRSAGTVAEWLVSTGRVRGLSQAEAVIRAAGRPVHLISKAR
jgi:hypothetical protein